MKENILLSGGGQVMRTPLSFDNETYFRSSLRHLLQAKQP